MRRIHLLIDPNRTTSPRNSVYIKVQLLRLDEVPKHFYEAPTQSKAGGLEMSISISLFVNLTALFAALQLLVQPVLVLTSFIRGDVYTLVPRTQPKVGLIA